jgi:excisionase family DNA binding protein
MEETIRFKRGDGRPRKASRKLVPISEAADYLGVTPRTIRRYISDGKLTGFRIADAVLVRVDLYDVDRLAKPIPAAAAASGQGL